MNCEIPLLKLGKLLKQVNIKKFVFVGIGVAAAAAAVMLFTQLNLVHNEAPPQIDKYELDFTYETVNSDLRTLLMEQHINMSKPLRFSTPSDLDQYCNFLSNQTKQEMIQYCTSTEIKDESGKFLGNLDMVGSSLAPVLVIATAETDPLFSNYKEVKILFDNVLNETVCDCWAKEKPGGYSTLADMMDALRDFHVNGKEPNSTTRGIPLGGKHFEIEISTNPQGYLWKLLVAK